MARLNIAQVGCGGMGLRHLSSQEELKPVYGDKIHLDGGAHDSMGPDTCLPPRLSRRRARPQGVSTEKATGIIGVSEFRRHLDHISEGGWEVVSTTRIVDWLEGEADIPDRALVLHFDNGWLDTATTVMPVLVEYGMAGTAYVITDGATAASEGRTAGVHTSTEGAVQKPFMTWRQISELLDGGWEIGAHTATHPKLADLQRSEGDEAVVREIEASSRAYAEHLGFVPRHFAYPSGSRNRRTDALLAPYYRSLRLWSFSQPPRWEFTGSGTPPAALKCQNVDSTVAFEDFARIFTEAVGQ